MDRLTLLPAATILQNIGNLSKRVDGLDNSVHETAVQCMLHAKEHGDVMLADRLVKTLGGKNSEKAIEAAIKAGHKGYKMGRMTGYNVRGLVMWFIRFSPIYWNGDGKPGMLKANMALYEQLLNRNEGKAWSVEAAAEKPFWTLPEVHREMVRQPFTIESIHNIVIGLKDRINRAVEAGTFKGDPDAARAYVDALATIPEPPEDEGKIILPRAENIAGTTFAGNNRPTGTEGAEPDGRSEEEKNAEKAGAELDNRGDVKVA